MQLKAHFFVQLCTQSFLPGRQPIRMYVHLHTRTAFFAFTVLENACFAENMTALL